MIAAPDSPDLALPEIRYRLPSDRHKLDCDPKHSDAHATARNASREAARRFPFSHR